MCKENQFSIAACTIFCWLFKWLSDKLPFFNKAQTKRRTGREATCKMNFSDYWPTDKRWWHPRGALNHPHDFLLIDGFGPLDKTAGEGLLEKLKGQPKTNSAYFQRDILLNNIKQTHQRRHRQFKVLSCHWEDTINTVCFFISHHLSNSDCYVCWLIYCLF